MAVCIIMVDTGLHQAKQAIDKIDKHQRIIKQRRLESIRKREGSIYANRRVTSYKHRGFAFSGEAGNDPMVTDSLTKKVQKSFMKSLIPAMPNVTKMLKKGSSKQEKANLSKSKLDTIFEEANAKSIIEEVPLTMEDLLNRQADRESREAEDRRPEEEKRDDSFFQTAHE